MQIKLNAFVAIALLKTDIVNVLCKSQITRLYSMYHFTLPHKRTRTHTPQTKHCLFRQWLGATTTAAVTTQTSAEPCQSTSAEINNLICPSARGHTHTHTHTHTYYANTHTQTHTHTNYTNTLTHTHTHTYTHKIGRASCRERV